MASHSFTSYSSLSSNDLAKAYSELNEPTTSEEKSLRIENLRKAFIKEHRDMPLLRNDDSFFLRFLRARKYHQGLALIMMRNYHAYHYFSIWPEVSDILKNPALVKEFFDAGCHIPLKGRAKDGSTVCVGFPGKINRANYSEYVATLFLTYKHLLEDERVQVHGVTVIYDLSYINLGMLCEFLKCVKRILELLQELLQDVIPLRIKSVNLVNTPTWFQFVYAIVIRPLMKKKIRERYIDHGSSFVKLHEVIDPKVLPPAYGGTGSPIEGELASNWRDAVFEYYKL